MSVVTKLTFGGAHVDQLSINTLRFLAVDAVQKAQSGHLGLPLGAAPMTYALWARLLRHHPTNPQWVNRDCLVYGASALGEAVMHEYGCIVKKHWRSSISSIININGGACPIL